MASLLFLPGRVAPAYAHPNTGRLLTSIKQSQQQPTSSAGPAQNDGDMRTLEAGKLIKRELAGKEAHSYQVTLAAGQYLHVIVVQRGIDVVVRAFAPDGKMLAEFDNPRSPGRPVPVLLLTAAAGSYQLEVRSWDLKGATGRYDVRIAELRAATQQDKDRVRAEQAYREGKHLHLQGKAESLKPAAEKYTEALSLLRAVGDHAREATMLAWIGDDYFTSRDGQNALHYLSQALSLFRAVSDRQQEAHILNGIGAVYLEYLGERGKRLTISISRFHFFEL